MLLYRVLLTLVWPVLAILLAVRVLRGRERWSDWAERVGMAREKPGALWVHGASNGELQPLRPVLALLLERYPQLTLLVSCNSLTARNMVTGWALPRTRARLAPLDTRWGAPAARAHVTLESELWPNRIRRLPTAVLGGRLSARTARGWRRVPGLAGAVYPRILGVMPQDTASAERFAELGIAQDRITDPVQLKAGYTSPDRAVPDDIAAAFPRDLTWLAASTHEGEEEVVVQAHAALLSDHPQMRLILAPRHPARATAVAAILTKRGFAFHRRSDGSVPDGTHVLLADTMGEMDLWYRSAFATFVGGSVTDRGGHTPFEPAALDSAILHGPHVRNFAGSYTALKGGGALEIRDAQSLAAGLSALMDTNTHHAQTARASAVLNAQSTIESIVDWLEHTLILD